LDLTKAFDRINHDALFIKLMDRNVPGCIVSLLVNWYFKLNCSVSNAVSNIFKLSQGVRQGGILSAILFAAFVNSILVKLEKVNLDAL
jgi:retron-type reverse transcriptase